MTREPDPAIWVPVLKAVTYVKRTGGHEAFTRGWVSNELAGKDEREKRVIFQVFMEGVHGVIATRLGIPDAIPLVRDEALGVTRTWVTPPWEDDLRGDAPAGSGRDE